MSNQMRLDKYLKVSTLIKRRTLAKAAAQKDLVFINDKLSKPSSTVKVGDIIRLEFSRKIIVFGARRPESAGYR